MQKLTPNRMNILRIPVNYCETYLAFCRTGYDIYLILSYIFGCKPEIFLSTAKYK